MRKFILIFVFLSLAIWGCDDGDNLYGNEIIVSEDCTIGDRVGVEFDSDSVRCGMNGYIFFGIERIDKNSFSPFASYVFSDSGAKNTKDSVWMLETDPDKYALCEKMELFNNKMQGVFCLKTFYDSTTREIVNYYDVAGQNDKHGYYFRSSR